MPLYASILPVFINYTHQPVHDMGLRESTVDDDYDSYSHREPTQAYHVSLQTPAIITIFNLIQDYTIYKHARDYFVCMYSV